MIKRTCKLFIAYVYAWRDRVITARVIRRFTNRNVIETSFKVIYIYKKNEF